MRWERTVTDGMAFRLFSADPKNTARTAHSNNDNPVKRMRFLRNTIASRSLCHSAGSAYRILSYSAHSKMLRKMFQFVQFGEQFTHKMNCIVRHFYLFHSIFCLVKKSCFSSRNLRPHCFAAFGRLNSFHYFAQFVPRMINDLISHIFHNPENKITNKITSTAKAI